MKDRTPYNMSFACFDCYKSFKREFNLSEGTPEQLVCPNCSGVAYNLGRHFKAPKKSDAKQWEKIRFLFEHGFRFQKIHLGPGDKGTVAYPETLEQAKEFVIKYKEFAIKNGA